MATIYKCDKCGKENKEPHNIVAIPVMDRFSKRNWYAEKDLQQKHHDLCDDCLIALNEFLKPLTLAPGTFIEVKN